MYKLDRAQKCSILGPQNLGWGGAGSPLQIHTCAVYIYIYIYMPRPCSVGMPAVMVLVATTEICVISLHISVVTTQR